MQIVREITSKKAIYMFPDFEPIDIDASRMVVGRTKALDIKDTTHEVVAADAPDLWIGGGVLSYDLAWAVSNQEAYDEAVVAKEAVEVARLTAAIQSYLDDTAVANGYDNILSACSYAGSVNPFQVEGESYVLWRGNVWVAGQSILNAHVVGDPVPTFAEILAQLPTPP